jgi:hypothetical protein
MADHNTDSGGYSEKIFVDEVDNDLFCPVCQDVLKNPFQSLCGHMHCLSCWNDLPIERLENTVVVKCTLCVSKTSLQNLSPCRFAKICIEKMLVRCNIESNSTCDWIGILSAMNEHKVNCQFQPPKTSWNLTSGNNTFISLSLPFAKGIVQKVISTRKHKSALCSLKLRLKDKKVTISVKSGQRRVVSVSWSDLFVRLYTNHFPRIVSDILTSTLKDPLLNTENYGLKDPFLLHLRDMILYFLWGDLVCKVMHLREFGLPICDAYNEFDQETVKSILDMNVVDQQMIQTLLTKTLAQNNQFITMVDQLR